MSRRRWHGRRGPVSLAPTAAWAAAGSESHSSRETSQGQRGVFAWRRAGLAPSHVSAGNSNRGLVALVGPSMIAHLSLESE